MAPISIDLHPQDGSKAVWLNALHIESMEPEENTSGTLVRLVSGKRYAVHEDVDTIKKLIEIGVKGSHKGEGAER